MAVIADYVNMSVSLVLSNKQGTDVEYRLPNDIRKQFDDFALPDGYEMVRGTIANGAHTDITVPDANVMFGLFLSDACTVLLIDDSSEELELNLATLVLSANKDANIGLKTGSKAFRVTNGTGASVEYTYIVINT